MTEKTTNWTPEELETFRRQRTRDYWPAYEQDARGHKVPVKTPWEGHICPDYEHCSLCVDEAWDCGAAVMGGLMAMGQAIKDEYTCRHCGTWQGTGDHCRCWDDS